MGVELYALVTDWDAIVAACREAGGLDFYWDTDELPYADEFSLPSGRRYYEVADYYGYVRQHLPDRLRAPADAAFGMVAPGWGWDFLVADRDDLSADVGVHCGDLIYALRPATARAVTAIEVPWDELREIGERHPIPDDCTDPPREYMHRVLEWGDFEGQIQTHLECVADAAARGRGILAVISQ